MDTQAARVLHKGYDATCDRCGEKYCPECANACPSCCLHDDCIAAKERDAALEALEEARQFREKIQNASDKYGYSHNDEFMDVIFAILKGESA